MGHSTRAVKGRHGNTRLLYFLFLELMLPCLPHDPQPFYFVFSTLSLPLFGWLLSPFSLTFQPHYTASEQNSGRQLLEMVHLLKMSLMPSTRFHQSHSEWRRTTPSLVEENGKLNLGCKMFLLKEEPNLHEHAPWATWSQNAAHYSNRLKRLQLLWLWNSHPNKNKNPSGHSNQ